jgi:hypothetical protein
MKLSKATQAFSAATNINSLRNNNKESNIDENKKEEEEKEQNGQIQISLRFIYSFTKNLGKMDIGRSHKGMLQEMQKMDTTIHIIPNDEDTTPYTDLNFFPNTELDFKRHFKVIEENNKITVCHDIITTKSFNDLKYHKQHDKKIETTLLQYMKEQNIVMKTDKFDQKRTTSIGLLICINPDIVHRDTLHKDLSDALDDLDLYDTDYNHFFYDMSAPLKSPPREEMEEETLRFAPEFEIGYGTTSYKDSNQCTVSIKTLDIQCASRDAQFLKELFSAIDFTEYYKTMLFIPRGLTKLNNDPEAYKKYIDLHINYMQNTTQFAIVGLTKEAYNFEIETEHGTYTPKQILGGSPYVEAIHTTANTTTKGIWLLVTTKNDLNAAIEFFDTEIMKIYEFIPNSEKYIDERNLIPTRLAKQRRIQSTKTIERAIILNNTVPQTITVNLNPNNKSQYKRQIQDNGNVPSKQQKTVQNDISQNKTTTTDTTLDTEQNTYKDMDNRLKSMEEAIKKITTQAKTDETSRLQAQQYNKQEITELIKTTIKNELPTITGNFEVMTKQIIDLNYKFDQLMNSLHPQNVATSQPAIVAKANIESTDTNKVTINGIETQTVNSHQPTPVLEHQQQQQQPSSPTTPKTNTSAMYATPVNQWNIIGSNRKTKKDTPISREKTIKENSTKERLRQDE